MKSGSSMIIFSIMWWARAMSTVGLWEVTIERWVYIMLVIKVFIRSCVVEWLLSQRAVLVAKKSASISSSIGLIACGVSISISAR